MYYNNTYQTENYEILKADCDAGIEKAIMIDRMRRYLAKRNSTIIWGSGIVFESQDEKLTSFFNDYYRKQQILPLMVWTEELLSRYGRVIITISKTRDGKYKLNLTDPVFLNAVGKSFFTEELAVVWQRFVYDNQNFWVKSTYTKQYCKNEIFVGDETNKIRIFDQTETLPKECQVEPVWHHNLGFIPLVEITNFPNLAWMGANVAYNEQTDWYNGILFESLYYQAFTDFRKELILNHSRIGIENATQQQIQAIEKSFKGIENQDILKDYTINTNPGSKVTVIPGVGDFGSYTNAMDTIMDFYCKFANSSRFSDGGGAQKSTQEVKTTRSAQVEAINTKITLRELKWTEIFAKFFSCYKLMDYHSEDLPFTFKINGNIQKDETILLDGVIKQVNLGTMSIVEAIAALRKISLKDAEAIFEKIQEFNSENDLLTSMMGMDDLDSGDGQTPQGGKPEESGDF